MEKEKRIITCPKCDPSKTNPDHVTGYKESLKYLVFGKKCKQCGTMLEDLGTIREKIIPAEKIDTCLECKFNDWGLCRAYGNGLEKSTNGLVEIPEWCPLEDA